MPKQPSATIATIAAAATTTKPGSSETDLQLQVCDMRARVYVSRFPLSLISSTKTLYVLAGNSAWYVDANPFIKQGLRPPFSKPVPTPGDLPAIWNHCKISIIVDYVIP